MTPRERNLLFVLGAILLGGVALFAFQRWFITPLKDYNAAIADLREKNEANDAILGQFFVERKKLEMARLKSLPAKPEETSLVYQEFLKKVLRNSELDFEQITPGQLRDIEVAIPIPGIKKTGHKMMTFSVRARGSLEQLVSVLEEIQQTPYEHRISRLNIDRKNLGTEQDTDNTLNIQMTIDTLLAAKTKNRPDTFAASAAKLTPLFVKPANRDYALLSKKNIFVGDPGPLIKYIRPPPIKIAKEEEKEDPTPEAEPDVNVPAYVRLVQTVPDQQEAYLRDLVQQSRETKLIAKRMSGYDTFRIYDHETDYTFFRAKVLRVDSRTVYFQVLGDVYAVKIGQNLADAMQTKLDVFQRDEANVETDKTWAAEEEARLKKKKASSTKRTP
jgi:hypothetical protein